MAGKLLRNLRARIRRNFEEFREESDFFKNWKKFNDARQAEREERIREWKKAEEEKGKK